MADTEQKIEALEKEAVKEANAVNPQADAPKKNAVAAEPTHLKNDAEDLGPAVVKPIGQPNPDATKKVKKVEGQAPQKNQGAADAMPTLKKEESDKDTEKKSDKEEVKEGELPPALQKAIDKKKEDKKEVKETIDAGEVSKMADKKKEVNQKTANVAEEDGEKKKEKELDVKEHVDALIAGENDLSEEFKQKASTIFEAAIRAECTEIAESMEADYQEKLEQESAKAKAELTEKVDSYLSYVVEEWMKENSIALEKGIKGEIAEDFITGLKKLFAEHYIDVPDEKYDVLDAQATKIEKLEKKLNEEIQKNVDLNKENGEKTRNEIMSEVSNDLADTSKEKFGKLAEEIEYSSAEDFRKKCETIKESYFGKKAPTAEEKLDDVAAGEASNEDLSNAMAAYSAAISKTKDIKLSLK